MKINKKIAGWILGSLTVLSLLVVVKCSTYENRTRQNTINCEKVKHGMTTNQVIEIMGEPNNIKTFLGKIDYKDMEVTKYYYDAPSLSSVGVNIFFDVQTKTVVRSECKD